MALTPKQEKFAQCVASGMNNSDAYRAAYPCKNMSGPAINEEAYRSVNHPDISLRIEELRLPIAERIGMGLESYLKDLIEMRNDAKADADHNPAIKAHELVGKALGYYVNKTELTGKGGEALSVKLTKEIIDTDQSKTS